MIRRALQLPSRLPETVEVMHRALAAAEVIGVLERLRDEGLCREHRVRNAFSFGERRSDRRGKGAARAVRVLRRHAPDAELAEVAAVEEKVCCLGIFSVTALYHHVCSAEAVNLPGRLTQIIP